MPNAPVLNIHFCCYCSFAASRHALSSPSSCKKVRQKVLTNGYKGNRKGQTMPLFAFLHCLFLCQKKAALPRLNAAVTIENHPGLPVAVHLEKQGIIERG